MIRLRGMLIMLGMAVTLIRCGVIVEGDVFSNHKILEAERKLTQLRKPAVKTIQSEDGDIIDCIDIYKQPAFDHPALTNHTIQMAPTYDPTRERKTVTKVDRLKKKNEEQSSRMVKQKWRKSGSCPPGTIPVRRVRKKELLRASSVKDYGRKKQSTVSRHAAAAQFGDNKTANVLRANHSKAILLTVGYRYTGGKGDIKVYNPMVDLDDDYSTSQVSLLNSREMVESGWAVNPSVYGDRETRFFVYWTADDSKKTGCFDLTCPGFVQVSNKVALGAAIYPVSFPHDLPYEIIVYVFKDPVTSNWWVQYGESIYVGYWPPQLFLALSYHATSVEWGGEVYSPRVGTTPHTETDMGSGQFADFVWGTSGSVKRIRIHDNSPELKLPEYADVYMDEFNCYDVKYLVDYVEEPEFYYGGPACMNCSFDTWTKTEAMTHMHALYIIKTFLSSSSQTRHFPLPLSLSLSLCKIERDAERSKMGKRRIVMLLLAMGLFVFSGGAADHHPHVKSKANQATLEVRKMLKLLNKPGVKTIKSEDGDIVDCVDIYKQPAFDHPALRNHKIQMTPNLQFASEAPSSSPSPSPGPSASSPVQNDHNSSQQILSQIWQKSGSCPDGTIPIRRIRRQDLLRAASLEHFGKKPANSYYSTNDEKGSVIINGTRVELGPQINRSAAILITVVYSYTGAQGDINIWNPRVQSPDEFTTAQIWLKNGPGDAFESVESGWVVNPKLYGDGASRLFVYWTKDAYKSTGCFDLTCSGFVHTNKDLALGMALAPVSSEMGPQYQATFSITKDSHTNNWWVRVGQNIPVGYFPPELFFYLTRGVAALVEWGGEVYSSKIKKNHPHTATEMGSGDFAWGKLGNACYIKQVRIIDYSMQLKYPEWVGTYTDEEYCYTALNYAASLAEEPVFYFGGPGLNPPDCN
ncbi:unnamed protein product [Malus baccata var. baccata]